MTEDGEGFYNRDSDLLSKGTRKEERHSCKQILSSSCSSGSRLGVEEGKTAKGNTENQKGKAVSESTNVPFDTDLVKALQPERVHKLCRGGAESRGGGEGKRKRCWVPYKIGIEGNRIA